MALTSEAVMVRASLCAVIGMFGCSVGRPGARIGADPTQASKGSPGYGTPPKMTGRVYALGGQNSGWSFS